MVIEQNREFELDIINKMAKVWLRLDKVKINKWSAM